MKLGQIRKKVASECKIPFNGFTLESGKRIFDMIDNDISFKDSGEPIKLKVIRYKEHTEDPDIYLSQNQEYINKLYMLLSNDNAPYIKYVWHILNLISCSKNLESAIKNANVDEKVF